MNPLKEIWDWMTEDVKPEEKKEEKKEENPTLAGEKVVFVGPPPPFLGKLKGEEKGEEKAEQKETQDKKEEKREESPANTITLLVDPKTGIIHFMGDKRLWDWLQEIERYHDNKRSYPSCPTFRDKLRKYMAKPLA